MKLEKVFVVREKFDKVCDYLENKYMSDVKNRVGYIFKLFSPKTREIDENTLEVRNIMARRVILKARAERILENETRIQVTLDVSNGQYIALAIVSVITFVGPIALAAVIWFRNSRWKTHFAESILPPIYESLQDVQEITA